MEISAAIRQGKRRNPVCIARARAYTPPAPLARFAPLLAQPNMTERDVERDCTRTYFAEVLRRLADAVEAEESFRIQIAGKRFTIPAHAGLSIEHEAADGTEEVEFQLRWTREDA